MTIARPQRAPARRWKAAQATERRILADIDDSELKAPRDGRIQYRVAEPGEVLAAGGRVLNMVDLADVYMTFFLPTEQAGLLALGSEARLVLDAAPDLVIPANISFVASVAQFTPKTVETSDERLKLMFRVKEQALVSKFLTSSCLSPLVTCMNTHRHVLRVSRRSCWRSTWSMSKLACPVWLTYDWINNNPGLKPWR